jgi:hypothetical protein
LTLIIESQWLLISRNIFPIAPLLLALFADGVQITFSKFFKRYTRYYHFNIREIYKALPRLLQQQIVPSIYGYEVIEILRENVPEVWVWSGWADRYGFFGHTYFTL